MIKYRFILVSIFLLSLGNQSQAQTFAPTGAEWTYLENLPFSNDYDQLIVRVIGDTLINGNACRVIHQESSCFSTQSVSAVFQSGDSVFLYNEYLDSFQLLYNFNASQGESWQFLVSDGLPIPDTVIVTVNAVTNLMVNGNSIRKQEVTYTATTDYKQTYQSEIVENIGDLNYLFNFYPYQNTICDQSYPEGLLCYTDNNLGYYHTGESDACKSTSIGGIKNEKLDIRLYPNPVIDQLFIRSITHDLKRISIYSISGELVASEYTRHNIASYKLNVSHLPRGMYLVEIKANETRVWEQIVLSE